MPKKNCWESKECGREPGGRKAGELGECPAAKDTRLDGVHGGKNAGRACWMIAGTLCDGVVQGTFAQKMKNCLECEFYLSVKDKETGKFQMSAVLLKKLT